MKAANIVYITLYIILFVLRNAFFQGAKNVRVILCFKTSLKNSLDVKVNVPKKWQTLSLIWPVHMLASLSHKHFKKYTISIDQAKLPKVLAAQ